MAAALVGLRVSRPPLTGAAVGRPTPMSDSANPEPVVTRAQLILEYGLIVGQTQFAQRLADSDIDIHAAFRELDLAEAHPGAARTKHRAAHSRWKWSHQ